MRWGGGCRPVRADARRTIVRTQPDRRVHPTITARVTMPSTVWTTTTISGIAGVKIRKLV